MELNIKKTLIIAGAVLGVTACINTLLYFKYKKDEEKRHDEYMKQKKEELDSFNKQMDELSKDMNSMIESITPQIIEATKELNANLNKDSENQQ